MATVIGSVTLDLRSSVSPGMGGEMMVKLASPVAVPLKVSPSPRTYTYRARKPDQGHNKSLCSNLTSRSLPPSFVGTKSGSASKTPARDNDYVDCKKNRIPLYFEHPFPFDRSNSYLPTDFAWTSHICNILGFWPPKNPVVDVVVFPTMLLCTRSVSIQLVNHVSFELSLRHQ